MTPAHLLDVAARATLLDALDALRDQLDAVTVVGAQAVALRTGPLDLGVAEFTTDADLALDPELLVDLPRLADALGSSFSLDRDDGGNIRPGAWSLQREVGGESVAIAVDLMVPEGIAPPGGRRGARLPVHGALVARKAAGLEAAMVDFDLQPIRSLTDDDDRVIECRVAGAAALLIAKAHKIQDRIEQEGERRRVTASGRTNDKDAGDVYRLMLTTPSASAASTISSLLADDRSAVATKRGIELLRRQFGTRSAVGLQMAIRSLRIAVPEARVASVCSSFVEGLSSVSLERNASLRADG